LHSQERLCLSVRRKYNVFSCVLHRKSKDFLVAHCIRQLISLLHGNLADEAKSSWDLMQELNTNIFYLIKPWLLRLFHKL